MTDNQAALPVPCELQPANSAAVWISATEFQTLTGTSKQGVTQALAKCHSGGTWRGHALQVRMVESQGGNAGKVYQVFVPSLPPELRNAWMRAHPELSQPLELSRQSLAQTAPLDPKIAALHGEWQWRMSLIAAALKFHKNTPGRAQILREVADQTHTRPNGKRVKVALRTLHLWVEKVEAGGEFALVRKPRAKESKARYHITKQWDQCCPLPDDAKAGIAADFDAYVRGLWVKGVTSGVKCAALASSKLLELARAAGWRDATPELCTVRRDRVERFKSARIAAVKTKDAKRFADDYVPRIRRTREGLRPIPFKVFQA